MTFASMVAKKQGWALNPDAEFTKDLVEGLHDQLEPLRLLPLPLPRLGRLARGRCQGHLPLRSGVEGRRGARPLLLRPLPGPGLRRLRQGAAQHSRQKIPILRMTYLDWASTSPPDSGILAEAARVAGDSFGNPSSRHALGAAARDRLEEARSRLAAAIFGPGVDGAAAAAGVSRASSGAWPSRAEAPRPTRSPSSPC